jgi:hypothetical protein
LLIDLAHSVGISSEDLVSIARAQDNDKRGN